MERNKFDDLMEKVMHYEAKTGHKPKVVLKTTYLEVLRKHEEEFFRRMLDRGRGIIWGIPFYINDEQEEDYILARDWTEK